MNDDRGRELRRLRSTLRSLALGITAFGLWSVLKTIMTILMTPLENFLGEDDIAVFTQLGSRNVFYILAAVMVVVFASIDLIPRLYVARKARKESLGQDQGRAWVVWAFILLVLWVGLDIAGIVLFRNTMENTTRGKADVIVSMILDLSATVILGELCVTAVRLKKMTREEG